MILSAWTLTVCTGNALLKIVFRRRFTSAITRW